MDMRQYPNIQAVMEGRVSGQVTEWSVLRSELLAIVAEVERLKVSNVELYEALEQVISWMEKLESLGITNDDLYTDISYFLAKARGELIDESK